jgi:16S rRNA (uracil1498-N3)-methyltransferase
LQAIPKGKLFELIIQKATELGAARIVPLLSERVVVDLNKKEAARKWAKWQLVAVEAIKQCGAHWLPRVESPITPRQFLAGDEHFDLVLLGSLQADAKHPRAFLQSESKPKSAAVWIGPEGDFAPGEIDEIKTSGAHPITLGPLVLRTETAATYCLSILNYEFSSEKVT